MIELNSNFAMIMLFLRSVASYFSCLLWFCVKIFKLGKRGVTGVAINQNIGRDHHFSRQKPLINHWQKSPSIKTQAEVAIHQNTGRSRHFLG